MNRLVSAFCGFVLCISFITSGCAGGFSHVGFGIWGQVTGPVQAHSDNVSTTKVGKSTMTSWLGWIGVGDASLTAACESGGITKISHVDYEYDTLLGIWANWTIIVYGD